MSNFFSGPRGWIAIFTVAAVSVALVVWLFFPQLIQQVATGIVAFFAFLVGLIFRRRKS